MMMVMMMIMMMVMMVMMMMMMMMMVVVIVIMVEIMVIMTGSFYNHLSKICTSINTIIIDLLLLSTSLTSSMYNCFYYYLLYVRIQHRLHELLQASASTEHARRSLELEKADLLQTYRVVLQEKRRLEEDMNSIR